MTRVPADNLKEGARFIHAQRGLECRIVRLTATTVYYAPVKGMSGTVSVSRRNFKTSKVERWL